MWGCLRRDGAGVLWIKSQSVVLQTDMSCFACFSAGDAVLGRDFGGLRGRRDGFAGSPGGGCEKKFSAYIIGIQM